MSITTNSARETKKFAKNFAKKVKNGGVICLYGDLGSGKTTFTQGLVEGLKMKIRIVSPTFIIARQYPMGENFFYHVDLYRLHSPDEAKAIGIEEMWQGKNIVVIEWPQILENILPKNCFKIKFTTESENVRKIEINHST